MGSRKILVVEDEFITASDLKATLEKDGYTVSGVARTGEEAIQLAGQDPPDLVLMDIQLDSSMYGIETALRKVKPGVPVILASGYDEASVMSGDHDEWPQAFLGKPYSLKDLRKAIGRVVR